MNHYLVQDNREMKNMDDFGSSLVERGYRAANGDHTPIPDVSTGVVQPEHS